MRVRDLLNMTWNINEQKISVYLADCKTKKIVYQNYDREKGEWQPFGKCEYLDYIVDWIYEVSAESISLLIVEPPCTYEKCLSCELLGCWTGHIARTQGKQAYEAFLEICDKAELNETEEVIYEQ